MNFHYNYLQRPNPPYYGSPVSIMAFPLTVTCQGSQTDTSQGQQYTDFSVDRILGNNSNTAPTQNTPMNQPIQSQMCPPYMNSYGHFNEMSYTCTSPLYNGFWPSPWAGYSAVPRAAGINVGSNVLYNQDVKPNMRAQHSAHPGDDEISLITINDDSDGQEQLPSDFYESDEDSQVEIDSESGVVADKYLIEPEKFEGIDTDFENGIRSHDEAEEIDSDPPGVRTETGGPEKFTRDDDSVHVTQCHSDSTMEDSVDHRTQPESPMSSENSDDEADLGQNILSAHIPGPWRHEYLEVGRSPVLIHTQNTFRPNAEKSIEESPRTSEVGSVKSGAESLGTKCTKLFTEIDEYATYLDAHVPATNDQPEEGISGSAKKNVENAKVDAGPMAIENIEVVPGDFASLEITPEYDSSDSAATTAAEEVACCSRTLPRADSVQPDGHLVNQANNEPRRHQHRHLKIVTHEMVEKILANLNVEFCASKLAPKRLPISKRKKTKAVKRLSKTKTESNPKKNTAKNSGKIVRSKKSEAPAERP